MLLKYTIRKSTVAPYLLTRPNLAFLASSLKNTSEEEEMRIEQDLKNVDLGLNFGLGVSLQLLNRIFFIEGRYTIGLVDINEHATNLFFANLDVQSDVKTKGFQLLVGILFSGRNNSRN